MLVHVDFIARLREEEPEEILKSLVAEFHATVRLTEVEPVRRSLRLTKAKASLLVALCDLGGVWDVEAVIGSMTLIADAALQAALNFLLLANNRKAKLLLQDESDPSICCGYVVIAMGKHGAHELNFSSDIDLIVLYDPDTAPLATGIEPSIFFVKLTRDLVALLQDMTEDGYVFRVDLRLRPDPRATQVAIALEAAATYYENLGQNWERAAMIKARPAAGDMTLGNEFIARLKPYIWRRYLDFAAIADVQSLKRQIHAVKGHGDIAVRGHNIKLGRGGIREIEFFVQTQQLIAGGRNPALRGQKTLDMLDALADAKWIAKATAAEMGEAYKLLRRLEHRVQMVDDMQDQCIPEKRDAFENYVRFCGFIDQDTFSSVLRTTLETVQRHYQALFADSDELSVQGGNLVFTGGEDDPDTIETLKQLSFREASEVSATIRGWHFSRYNATRSKRSREILTELMPKLLSAFAATGDADQAFFAFDKFMQGLPAGVQLFSMLKANAHLLELIARILGTAPRLAQQLSRQPRILEAVLDPAFFGPLPAVSEIENAVAQMLTQDLPLEEAMDRARIAGREQMFRVGVRVLSETVSAEEAGGGYANVADVMVQKLHVAVERDMQRQFGCMKGGASGLIAMGKWGGREMAASSDLDLILVYSHDSDAEMSDGRRPLSPSQYFARLTQRLISAITAPTSEGTLYDVDMRLRPSGSKGPVAVSLESFIAYQNESAWTWEKMALTRARVVSAPAGLAARLQECINTSLLGERDSAKTLVDICDMRKLMLSEHKDQSRWDIKRKRGGLVEVEFIVQALMLVHAQSHPSILGTNTRDAIRNLASNDCIDHASARVLLDAWHLYSRITQLLRVSVEGNYEPNRATPALNLAVARAAAMPDISSTEALLDDAAQQVIGIFDKTIGIPSS